MKILSYNLLFGMKGDTLLDALKSHFAMHGLKPFIPIPYPNYLRKYLIEKRSKFLNQAIASIKAASVDVVCLNEIAMGIHGQKLIKALSKQGFKTFCWGQGGHYNYPYNIATLLAVKHIGRPFTVPIKARLETGSGGGACGIYIPSLNAAVIGVHLAIKEGSRMEQIKDLITFIEENKEKRLIITGDFNASIKELCKYSVWFKKTSKTNCRNTFPSFRLPFGIKLKKDIDHIFSNFGKLSQIKTLNGYSDHLGLICELNLYRQGIKQIIMP
jgi:hypothetical protein